MLFLSPSVHLVQWAHMRRFLSVVCLSVCLHTETLVGSLVCLKVQLLATFGLLAIANSNVIKSAVIGLKSQQKSDTNEPNKV